MSDELLNTIKTLETENMALKTENSKFKEKIRDLESEIINLKKNKLYQGGYRID